MSNSDFEFPVVVGPAGAVPTPPATLLARLIAAVSAVTPGYTANLPMSMVEDISSTNVAAMAQMDSAQVEAVNSFTPYGANLFTLAQLGQVYIGPGAAPAPPTNTSVTETFTVTNTATSSPQPGYSLPVGFTVGDGQFMYVVQDGGVTDSNGSASLFCVSPTPGTWPVAPGTVNEVVSSVPSPYAVACTNPLAGNTSTQAEAPEGYRARVLQAGQAVSQGMPTMLKTLVGQVPGVTQRLISVQQQSPSGWKVIVGGGDPYLVAGAIYDAVFDISTLVGSTLGVTGITQASPGVVTTNLNHGLATGQTAEITGVVGMTQINGLPLTVTVLGEKQFSVGLSTTGFSPYVSGGVISPNPRNVTVNIVDYPDEYSVPFVSPPNQAVTMNVSWNTTQPNFVQQAAVAQAAAPALAAYVNAIQATQPINLLVARQAFIESVAGILQPSQVSFVTLTVFINGVLTAPLAGTQLVAGDPEGYFTASAGGISVTQA